LTGRTHSSPLMRAALAATLLTASLSARAQNQDADQRAATAQDVIFARKALKDAVCDRLSEIERGIAGNRVDVDHARVAADAIAAMLTAFPHLFPPSSNRWKPDSDEAPESATLASPDLWSDFPDFYRQATAAAQAAFELSRARDVEDVKTRARVLRITCDTCHALYLEEP
jgi:cytochrome c556